MSSSHFALSALRGSRNGYSWLNSDERKGKSSRAFISPSISKKIFAKQSRASPVTKSRKLVRLCRRKKKNKVLENEYFLPRWKENFQEERTRNEILRVGREEKKKSESLQLPSSILSLRSHPRFPFFNVISQASDPAGFRFPFLFRALAPFLVSPSLAVTAPIYRKSIPRPMFPFVFLFVPFKERESFYGGTRMTKTEHLQEETLSLSFFLSLWRKTIFPRSNSSWTLFKSFDSHSIYLSRRDI